MKKYFLVLLLFAGAITVWAETDESGKFRFKNRMVEYAILSNVGVTNNFFNLGDFFQKTVVVDLTKLNSDLKLNLDAAVSPFTLNFNWKDRWGFGIFVNADVSGSMALSEKVISLSTADDEKIDLGLAAFAEAGGNGFFHANELKIKVRAAAFMPIAYTKYDISNISYTNKEDGTITKMGVEYDVRAFTAFPMEGDTKITATVGFDLGAGVEYPLFSFLDIGADVTHIPLVPATMKDFMQLKGVMKLEMDGGKLDDMDFDKMLTTDTGEIVYDTDNKMVLRPFKLVAWADYRPFETRLFSVIGSFGFAVNPLYRKPGSVEGSIKIRSDVANIVIVTIGSAYEDRLWKNGIDLVLNARALEFDLGIDMRSQKFTKSWTAGGVGVRFGIRMGW